MTSSPTPRRVASAYDFYAPIYDMLFGAVLAPGRTQLAQAVRQLEPASLLEVGVGTGLMLGEYPGRTRIAGIDLSTHMLERAHAKVARHGLDNVSLQAMNAERMDFPDDSFDCVTLPYVLSVTPDPARLVAEVRRVCRKGGTIFVLNHFSGSRFWWALERIVAPLANRIGFRSEFGLEENVLAHDWEVVSTTAVNLFGLSRLVTIRNA